ncbi:MULTISPECIES: Uma2 family endonuclease [unclassified Nostoc]|uniref:Uma2 family endonuclease n=1 Tax=unclassified Nostoc TaxID=2593658 RepID=UPI002AD599F0|nr:MULTISPECIES: Uma2 family endonuclease [unclassified Nostoc]MDZ8127001.1 Uma2 family endonuclease [Nostoc sp. CmiVER01]MDZ8222284.1 Uma2 family endonuclease [Nostoc sp. ChiVER01]
MVILSSNLSLTEFLQLPETKPASEYIDAKIYQKPMPQGKHSRIQTRLSTEINQESEPEQKALALTELRCTFGGRSLVPDIAVFEWSRLIVDEDGEIANKFQTYPDWIIEILSPDQFPNRVIDKILFCINHGTKLGWFIDSNDKSVMVFQPNKLPEVKYNNDKLTVLDVLTDWQITPADIFSWLKVK